MAVKKSEKASVALAGGSGWPASVPSPSHGFFRNPNLVLVVVAVAAVGLVVMAGALVGWLLLQDSGMPGEACVGVVELDGELVTGGTPASLFSQATPGSEDIAASIAAGARHDNVKALLIVVNSPGGTTTATRDIYDSLEGVDKPRVAYLRELAASGGYYVIAGSDYIVAHPEVLTGNIGVRLTLDDLSGLFEKIGYNVTVIKTGAHKDIGDFSRPMDEEERQILTSIVMESFNYFKQAVEDGRGGKITSAGWQQVLDGRIFSAQQAKSVGLVDAVGNRDLAVRKAADLAGLKYDPDDGPRECRIRISAEPGLDGLLSGSLSGMGRELAVALGTDAKGPRVEYA